METVILLVDLNFQRLSVVWNRYLGGTLILEVSFLLKDVL